MNIHFALRKQGKTDPVIILNAFDSRFPGRRFMYSTGYNIQPFNWRKKKVGGFPKENAELLPLIQHLQNLKKAAEAWNESKIGSKTLNREDLKAHLERLLKDEQSEQRAEELKSIENDFFTVWEKIIASTKHPQTGKPVTEGTKLQKRQSLKLLKEYCLDKGFAPTLLNIDMTFYHAFDTYMQGKGMEANTRGKHFKEIKAFMREAAERDYEVNRAFQKKAFKVIKEDVEDIYLTIDDIRKFIALDIKSPKKAEHRAQVVTACFTGLRQSDWGQHDERNIITIDGVDMLKVKPKKTGQDVYIPLHPVVRGYLKQYGRLKNISNQKMNEAIREIAKHALKDNNGQSLTTVLNGKQVNKYEHVTSHSMRRSFCTNAYLSRSIPVHTIMKISGHKSESSFLRYLKLGSMEHGLLAAEAKFFNDADWSTLKVA